MAAAWQHTHEMQATPLAGLPARIGPFDVHGVLAETGAGWMLLAHDALLARRVWIWLRPADDSPLNPARRDLSRMARLRWLAGGLEGPSQWDAFMALDAGAIGGSSSIGPLTWAQTRHLLSELADDDGTLPATLQPAQVWVRRDGRVCLLDAAIGPTVAAVDLTPLALLGAIAVWLLGATPRKVSRRPIMVGVPLPRPAAAILDRLLGDRDSYADIDEFRAALAAA